MGNSQVGKSPCRQRKGRQRKKECVHGREKEKESKFHVLRFVRKALCVSLFSVLKAIHAYVYIIPGN